MIESMVYTPYTMTGPDIWKDANVFKGIRTDGFNINTFNGWESYDLVLQVR